MKKHKGHTTHYACDEVMKRDGGKAIGCCCSGHSCKNETPRTINDIQRKIEALCKEAVGEDGLGIYDLSELHELFFKSIKDALEAVRIQSLLSVAKYGNMPAPHDQTYKEGYNKAATQYDENVKSFLGEKI